MIALLKGSDELPCTVRVLRILPLRLFTNATGIHRRYPDFSSAVTVASVPDEHWHCSFVRVELTLHHQTIQRSLLLFHMDNLILFAELIVKHHVPIEVLYAKRVGRGSGSWTEIHSEAGALFSKIKKAPPSVRPTFWAADVPTFTDKGHQVFGFASWYQPPWTNQESRWHWVEKKGELLAQQ